MQPSGIVDVPCILQCFHVLARITWEDRRFVCAPQAKNGLNDFYCSHDQISSSLAIIYVKYIH